MKKRKKSNKERGQIMLIEASMNRVTQTLQQISDMHAPVRRASKQKRKQLNKPWISNAILTPIKKNPKTLQDSVTS